MKSGFLDEKLVVEVGHTRLVIIAKSLLVNLKDFSYAGVKHHHATSCLENGLESILQ